MGALVFETFFERSNPYHVRARRRYIRLSEDQQAEIDVEFARHVRACENLGLEPDPAWICEAVDDLVNERGE
jgi:hypothetical protein